MCNMKQGLKIAHINAQSLLNKIDEFRFIFITSDIDVVCVSETWFKKDMPDELVTLNGYNLYRADRQTRAGGVAIYVKNTIYCKIVHVSPSDDPMEYIFLSLGCQNNNILVGTVYRPNNSICFNNLVETVREISLSFRHIIIAGDFNSNLLTEHGLINEFNTIGLFSVNSDIPTHFSRSNTLLDLFLVNYTKHVLLYDQISLPNFSRHDLIFLIYDFSLSYTDSTIYYRDYKSTDHTQLLIDLDTIPWNLIYYYNNINDKVSFFESNINHLYNKHIPLKSRVIKQRQQPWFNGKIKSLISKRDFAYHRWKRFKTEYLYSEYRNIRKEVVKEIEIAKAKFFGDKYKYAVTNKQKWKEIRKIGIGIGKVNKPANMLSVEKLDELNMSFTNIDVPPAPRDVFDSTDQTHNSEVGTFSFRCVDQSEVLHSILKIKSNATGLDSLDPLFLKPILPILLPYITHIFNYVLTTSIFPMSWKRAKIIPVPKSNNEFRPIAILPFLSKALENIIHSQINNFLNQHSLISDLQSGFRPNHSCATALIEVVENIRCNINKNHINFLILLDHSKAFDCVNHEILIEKLLNNFKFATNSANLIASYLSKRIQAVYANGVLSNYLELSRGVPQGSVLGPLLFTIYINDIAKIPNGFNMHIYADDVQLCFSCNIKDTNSCVNRINQNLDIISRWAKRNGLKLNASKTKCIAIARNPINTATLPSLLLNNSIIEYVKFAKNLGIVFDSTLTWNKHIEITIGQIYGMLRTLWSIKHFIPADVRYVIAKAYLLPKLLYCCEIYANCDYFHKHKLKVVSNDIVRFVYGIKRRDSIHAHAIKFYKTEFLKFIDFRVLIFAHKIIVSRQPNYLFSRFTFSISSRTKCIIPPLSQYLVSDRQFFVHATRLWNSLPIGLRNIRNTNLFKNKLLKHFTSPTLLHNNL